MRKRKGGAGSFLACFAAFFAAVMFWEVFLYDQINGSLQGFPAWAALFALPAAMLCAFITGWIKNRAIGRAGSILVMLILWIYYAAQLVYQRIFGSLFSVSMISMAGDAISDFRWALLSMLKQSLVVLGVSLLPVLLYALCLFIFKTHPHYGAGLHGAALILAAALWAAAVLMLPAGGTDDT
ncbi:MAG: hypothetical protein II485_03155, partial [Firmicutes bacterium]|nr:hypothetical protein [Bacillota bacterium]